MLSDASAIQQPLCSSDLSLKNKELNRTLEQFWVVWNEQYIRNLPPLENKKARMNLEIGSVVLIREEGKPRLRWPLGKIISFHYGKDGLIRAATMKTENGEIVRAVQKLHMLEVSVSQSHPENLKKMTNLMSLKTVKTWRQMLKLILVLVLILVRDSQEKEDC